jgi:hypothetical protein
VEEARPERAGEKAFFVSAPIRRLPSEDDAAKWQAAGRTVVRDELGRAAVQVVGFALSPTFDLSQTDGEPFEAESVAHLCCRAIGLDVEVYSDAYVLGWANGDMDLIRECAAIVLRVTMSILKDLTPADAIELGRADAVATAPARGRRETRARAGSRPRRPAGKREAASAAGGSR